MRMPADEPTAAAFAAARSFAQMVWRADMALWSTLVFDG
jgi:hypothetical protein